MLKNEYVSYLSFKTHLKSWITNNSFNDYKWCRIGLSCSKALSPLLRKTKTRLAGDFDCLNCVYSFRKNNKLKSHLKNAVPVAMPSKDTKILEFSRQQKSAQTPFITLWRSLIFD